jgi:hypothetical protein
MKQIAQLGSNTEWAWEMRAAPVCPFSVKKISSRFSAETSRVQIQHPSRVRSSMFNVQLQLQHTSSPLPSSSPPSVLGTSKCSLVYFLLTFYFRERLSRRRHLVPMPTPSPHHLSHLRHTCTCQRYPRTDALCTH